MPRTVAIDDAVSEWPAAQVVILGAGLDGRAWRMPGLASVDVFEVDHPTSQRDKRDRVGELPSLARSLRFVPVDFTGDDLDGALASAGHEPATATTWIWEGVVPYLTPAEVGATALVVGGRSAPGSRLVVNYQAPALSARIGRRLAGLLAALAGRADPLAHEPQRSAWTPAEFDAPIERVWQLWADPRQLERWWGPPSHPATVERHDLTPGGDVTYFMTGPEGEKHRGELKSRPGGDMIAYGGGTLVSSLIADGLLDELHLFVNPTRPAPGCPCSPGLEHHQQLRPVAARQFDCGIIALHFEPKRS